MSLVEATLSLFDVPWTLGPTRPVHVDVEVLGGGEVTPAAGDYLECAQMLVDATAGGLRATTARGAEMVGRFGAIGERWSLTIPPRLVEEGWWPELEDLISLVVTTGWRRAGWVPLHAAGLVRGAVGVVVCAGSRGGKTTFSLAMARRGWRLVGDDKLLLGRANGSPTIVAIKHMLNVDPAIRAWIPEVGDLSPLPIYSAWSPKRRVPLASIWPAGGALEMSATHLIALERRASPGKVVVDRLTPAQTIAALLRQSVIPNAPDVARPITSALAGLAQRLTGLRVVVPDGVYADPAALERLDELLS